jgi:hypothetical protein
MLDVLKCLSFYVLLSYSSPGRGSTALEMPATATVVQYCIAGYLELAVSDILQPYDT